MYPSKAKKRNSILNAGDTPPSGPVQNLHGFVLLCAVLLFSCGAAPKKRDVLSTKTDLVLEKVEIRGTKTFSPADLKLGLVTKEDPGWRADKGIRWIPVLGSEREFFDPIVWQRDLKRIRTYYAAHGFFDARIVNEVIDRDEVEKTVRISIKISEGKPTTFGAIDIEGLGEIKDAAELRRRLKIKAGQRFIQSDYLQAKEELAEALREDSYAFVSVRGRVYVDKKTRVADVYFVVDPGPPSKFGEVTVEGLRRVDEDKVRDVIAFKTGESYSPEELEKTQEQIYDLGVFSLVKVTPNLDVPENEEGEAEADEGSDDLLGDLLDEAQNEAEQRASMDPTVPVTIGLSEAKLWSVRGGVGAAAEKSRQDIHAQLNWSSRNFLGGLRRLEQFNTVGFAWAPSILSDADAQNRGLIVDSELRFTQPQFFEKLTSFELRLALERDVEPGFSLLSPSAKIGVRRKFFRRLTVDVAYNFALFFLSDINSALLDDTLRLNRDYVLEYFQQTLLLDYRDNIINPTSGFAVSIDLQQATKYLGHLAPRLGSEFDYFKPSLSVEGYLPFKFIVPQVTALRARVSTIYVYGRDKSPPLPQKVYGGGADSIRSFGRQKLSLYSYEGDPVPIGGLTRLEGVYEQRFRVKRQLLDVGDLWVAPFIDAASVVGGPLGFNSFPESRFNQPSVTLDEAFDSLLYGVGLGAWWLTPIGPIRLDVAYRLSDISDDARFRRCAVTPADDGRCTSGVFVPLAEDPVQSAVSRFNIIVGIGHSF